MPSNTVLLQLIIRRQPYQNPIRRCSRYPTQFPHIGIHNVLVRFQMRLDFAPPERRFIHLFIAHFITRMDGFYERCFDG